MATPNLYVLAADKPETVLSHLRSNPTLASAQDAHGYSLLHAAASYNHKDLLRALVQEFQVDVNLLDEDGETCLFVAESVDVARVLVEELGVDKSIKNEEGLTAEESIAADGSVPAIAEYLQGAPVSFGQTNGPLASEPPPLPPNVSLNIGTMTEEEAGGSEAIDPEFKRRIDELASRENFHSEEGQKELQELVTEAIKGVNAETQQRDVRRRTE